MNQKMLTTLATLHLISADAMRNFPGSSNRKYRSRPTPEEKLCRKCGKPFRHHNLYCSRECCLADK